MPASSARSVVSMSLVDRGVLRADLERQRGVGHPALQLRGEVDAQHVAVGEHVVGRQAVQGGVVDGGAQHARVRHRAERRVVAQVDRVRAGRVDHLVRVGVQLLEGHPLAGDVTQGGQHAGDELAGGAHLVDLSGVLEGHGSTLPRDGQATARGPGLRGGPAAKDEVAAPTGCGDCHGFARRSGWACGRIVCAIRPSTFGRLADSHLTRPGIEHVLDHLLPVSDDRTSGTRAAQRGFPAGEHGNTWRRWTDDRRAARAAGQLRPGRGPGVPAGRARLVVGRGRDLGRRVADLRPRRRRSSASIPATVPTARRCTSCATDLDPALADLATKGVRPLEPPRTASYGVVSRIPLPSGGWLGLYEPSHESPLTVFGGPAVREPSTRHAGLDWALSTTVLEARDANALADFYRRLLGWRVDGRGARLGACCDRPPAGRASRSAPTRSTSRRSGPRPRTTSR